MPSDAVTDFSKFSLGPRYIQHGDCYVLVQQGHLWVEGDNGAKSMDSRTFGPISASLVVGQADLVIWPPHRFGTKIETASASDRTVRDKTLNSPNHSAVMSIITESASAPTLPTENKIPPNPDEP
eukprot:c18884_g1_i5.p1 GENE.c18884_g1_i5~~c18884_g1_i5.p1  ORF type:complete len:125 (+),score=15.89 c18884_g1_i5:358-732(+)